MKVLGQMPSSLLGLVFATASIAAAGEVGRVPQVAPKASIASRVALDRWQRHLIDPKLPHRAIFIQAAHSVSIVELLGRSVAMKANFSSRMIVCAWLLLSLDTHRAQAQWVKKPSEELLARTPGLIHETFESPAMQSAVGYSVVLPPSYAEGSQRYPVVYWLHGGGGNECSSLFTSHAWRKLYASKPIREVILVYPNGYRSGYMDHHDGKVMVETMIIRELIPRIDQRYRTIASRDGRAVHGSSMGASGSLKFAIKYPDMFCTAVAYGGGAIDLANTSNRFVLDILERNLKSDPDLVRQNNTYHFLEKNHATVRQHGTQFLLICGDKDSWKESAVTFQAALKAKDIPCRLTLVPDARHDLRRTFAAQGEAAALFQDEVFGKMLSH